jgi:hypothetical protein
MRPEVVELAERRLASKITGSRRARCIERVMSHMPQTSDPKGHTWNWLIVLPAMQIVDRGVTWGSDGRVCRPKGGGVLVRESVLRWTL